MNVAEALAQIQSLADQSKNLAKHLPDDADTAGKILDELRGLRAEASDLLKQIPEGDINYQAAEASVIEIAHTIKGTSTKVTDLLNPKRSIAEPAVRKSRVVNTDKFSEVLPNSHDQFQRRYSELKRRLVAAGGPRTTKPKTNDILSAAVELAIFLTNIEDESIWYSELDIEPLAERQQTMNMIIGKAELILEANMEGDRASLQALGIELALIFYRDGSVST